jgi:hypothetical protein
MHFRKNEVDHVAQHWTHELRRIIQFGNMPFEQLRPLISERDYNASLTEWNRQTKKKKWYHLTSDVFCNLLYQVNTTVPMFIDNLFLFSITCSAGG